MRLERRGLIFVISLIVLAVLVAISMDRPGRTPGPSGEPTVPTPTPSIGPGSPSPATPAASPSPHAGADVSGTWSGTWTSTTGNGGGGAIAVDWTQVGADLEGSITLDGTACLGSGVVRGTVDELHIAFTVGQRDVTIEYEGTIAGGTMSGTFLTRCDIDSGTWTMQKVD
jgi:hypothetical protein